MGGETIGEFHVPGGAGRLERPVHRFEFADDQHVPEDADERRVARSLEKGIASAWTGISAKESVARLRVISGSTVSCLGIGPSPWPATFGRRASLLSSSPLVSKALIFIKI